MIKKETMLNVADNSGAKKVCCFGIYAGDTAAVGDCIMVSVKSAIPNGKVKKGDKYKAIIVRTRAPIRRKFGDDLSFGDNAVVLITEKGDPLGTRVMGLVPREVPQSIRTLAAGIC